jgi:hypothetical protein
MSGYRYRGTAVRLPGIEKQAIRSISEQFRNLAGKPGEEAAENDV